MEKLKPRLRFQEYKEGWKNNKIKDIIERISDPVLVDEDHDYYQIGIRSHGKGIFHKVGVKGIDLGNKRVFWVHENCLIVNIVFAWEQAIAKTTQNEKGKIASHRFPMFVEKNELSNIDYLVHYFMTMKGKLLLEMASPGGAGRNKTLGQREFENLKLIAPSRKEQTKIASFLTTVDEKIAGLKKQLTLLERYKKGVMQKIFSQELRFQDENGNDFPDWEEKKLGEIGDFQTSSIDKLSIPNEEEVFLVNYMNVYRHERINNETKKSLQKVTAKSSQILSCSLLKGDVLFTPSSETPSDIGHSVVIFEDLKQTVYSYHLMRYRPKIKIDILYSHYFCNVPSVLKQISQLASGSTRFTISVKAFSSIILNLPSLPEQQKIASFLSTIDEKIEKCQGQIKAMDKWKKGLLQQMFC